MIETYSMQLRFQSVNNKERKMNKNYTDESANDTNIRQGWVTNYKLQITYYYINKSANDLMKLI